MPALKVLSDASILPMTIVRGEGAQLFDDTGAAYWDFYGGHAVALLGQAHPGWVAAITQQAQALSFITTVAPLPVRDAAIDALCAFTKMDRAFLVNSGAEANEAAFKIARKATGREVIVAMEGGFHGRTMACLAVTHAGHYRSGPRAGSCDRAVRSIWGRGRPPSGDGSGRSGRSPRAYSGDRGRCPRPAGFPLDLSAHLR